MTKEEYQEYLKSDHWKDLRAEKWRKCRKNGVVRCAICASTDKLETHHLFYRSIYDVATADLRILCSTCHEIAHELISSGELPKYSTQHGMFAATKEKVKKARGLTGKNLFSG